MLTIQSKRWSLMMLGLVAAMACLGQNGNSLAAPAATEKPVVIKSANDPTKPVPGVLVHRFSCPPPGVITCFSGVTYGSLRGA